MPTMWVAGRYQLMEGRGIAKTADLRIRLADHVGSRWVSADGRKRNSEDC